MRIVNVRSHRGPCTYVGRPMPGRPGSALGNPFKLRKGDPPGTCLARYEGWLLGQIEMGDQAVLAALREISPASVLACWCVGPEGLDGEAVFADPLVCHAQVIARVWRDRQPPGVR